MCIPREKYDLLRDFSRNKWVLRLRLKELSPEDRKEMIDFMHRARNARKDIERINLRTTGII